MANPLPDDSRLWRLALVVPEAAAAAFERALEEGAAAGEVVALSIFPAPPGALRRLEALTRGEPERARLEAALAPIAAASGLAPPRVEIAPVPDADWVRHALDLHKPVRAGRYYVHASHDRALLPAGAHALNIDAGLAFGSGSHESTRGCLLALDRLAKARRFRRPLDLGCGSGILAMAIARTWRVKTRAADVDPRAAAVARSNARRNGLRTLVRVVSSDGLRGGAIRAGAPYDLVVANILARPLVRLAPALARHTGRGGVAVLSGFLGSQQRAVAAAYRAQGFYLERRLALGDWATLVLRRG